ncbi:hypothetical protein HZH68_010802 [Vespula germanica]|uniref:Uncharacterized protein n=1 Tax=Vespula germanica TaxID=30212 RepID=A0A834JSK9_VESGE|nr:hypothetical protein HZH68_010802 [Vespula germanica]
MHGCGDQRNGVPNGPSITTSCLIFNHQFVASVIVKIDYGSKYRLRLKMKRGKREYNLFSKYRSMADDYEKKSGPLLVQQGNEIDELESL